MLAAKQIEQRTQRIFDEEIEEVKAFWRRHFEERRQRDAENVDNESRPSQPRPYNEVLATVLQLQ